MAPEFHFLPLPIDGLARKQHACLRRTKKDGEGNAADLLSSGYDHAVVEMKRIAEDRFTVVDLARGYLSCSMRPQRTRKRRTLSDPEG